MRDGIENSNEDLGMEDLSARRRANRRKSSRRRSSTTETLKASLGNFRAWMSQANLGAEPCLLEDEDEDALSLFSKSGSLSFSDLRPPRGVEHSDTGAQEAEANADADADAGRTPDKRRSILRRPSGGEDLMAMVGNDVDDVPPKMLDEEEDYTYTPTDESDSDSEPGGDDEVLQILQFMPNELNELLQATSERMDSERITVQETPNDIMPAPVGVDSDSDRNILEEKDTGVGKESKPRKRQSLVRKDKESRDSPLPSSSLRSTKSTSKRGSVRSHRSTDSEQRPRRRSSTVGKRLDSSFSANSTRHSSSKHRRESAEKRTEDQEKRSERRERRSVKARKSEDKGRPEDTSSSKAAGSEEKVLRKSRRTSVSKAPSELDASSSRHNGSLRDTRRSKSRDRRSVRATRSSSVAPSASSHAKKNRRERDKSMSVSCSGHASSSRRRPTSSAGRHEMSLSAMDSSLRAPTTLQAERKKSVESTDVSLTREPSRHSRRKTASDTHNKSRRRERTETSRRRNTTGNTSKSGATSRRDHQLAPPKRQESFVEEVHCCDGDSNDDDGHRMVEPMQLVLKYLPDGSSHTVGCERTSFPVHRQCHSEHCRSMDIERKGASPDSSRSSHASLALDRTFKPKVNTQRQFLLTQPGSGVASIVF